MKYHPNLLLQINLRFSILADQQSILIIIVFMNYNQKATTFAFGTCFTHQIECEYFCFQSDCKRVCVKCFTESNGECYQHKKYVISRDCFQKSVKESFNSLKSKQYEALGKNRYSIDLCQGFAEKYKTEDDKLIQKLIKTLSTETQTLNVSNTKIKQFKSKFAQISKLIRYFQRINENGLCQMKMKLSSENGLKKFHQKSKNFSHLITKSTCEQYQSLMGQLRQEIQEKNQIEQLSVLPLLKYLILARTNSRCQRRDSKEYLRNKNSQEKNRKGTIRGRI